MGNDPQDGVRRCGSGSLDLAGNPCLVDDRSSTPNSVWKFRTGTANARVTLPFLFDDVFHCNGIGVAHRSFSSKNGNNPFVFVLQNAETV